MKKMFVLALLFALPVMAAETDAPGSPATGAQAIGHTRALGDVLGSFVPPGQGLPVGLEDDGAGNLYMTEISGDVLWLIDTTGAPISSFPLTPNTGNGLGVTTDGVNLWVTDTGGPDVDVYTLAGAYVSSFSVAGQTTFPEGITYNPNTGNLYVVDGDTTPPDNVFEYSTAGALLNTFPLATSSTDGIAYDPQRNSYWIYDSGSDTVTHYDTTFTPLESFPGTGTAGFGNGEGVGVIGSSLYVAATGANTIVEFDLTGAIPVELQTFTVE
jgi:sugar lactone lactonase YvrE